MKLRISTQVNGHFKPIFQTFNKELFNRLNPNKKIIKLRKFQGTKPGNRFIIEFPLRQKWEGLITETQEQDSFCYFTDEGIRLPFGLSEWRHRHWVIKKSDTDTIITEDIRYKTKNIILDVLLYPFIYLTIYLRKAQYRKIFKL